MKIIIVFLKKTLKKSFVNSLGFKFYFNQRFYDWCLSEERKLTETGAAARADLCVIDIQRRLVQTCADPVLSSPEVCLMNSMQHLYSNLIPE